MSEPPDRLGVAIIGCGRVAGHHVRVIEDSPDLELIALCDLDEQRARNMAPREHVKIYRNYRLMLDQNPAIDLVAIATPSGLHFPHALDVIESWGKSVVLEKPPTLKVAELDALEAAAHAQGAQVFAVFQYRFNAPVQRILSGLMNSELGTPRIVTIRQRWCRPQAYYDQSPWRGTYSLDGGALTNQGIHHLDLVQYLVGSVQEVYAIKGTFGARIETEDSIVATLAFTSGAIGTLEITTAARPDDVESSVSVIADKGYAILGGWATDKLLAYSPDPNATVSHSASNADAYGQGHREIYAGVVRSLKGQGTAAVDLDDVRAVLRLLHALYVSADEGRPVSTGEGVEFVPLGRLSEPLWATYETPSGRAEGS